MAWILSGSQNQRCDALASRRWSNGCDENSIFVPKDAKIKVAQRASYTTDSGGQTLSIAGQSQSEILKNLLNQVWSLWVQPEVERYRTEQIPIPKEIHSILLKSEDGEMRMHFNWEFEALAVIRGSSKINKGDGITFDQILDFDGASPPHHGEKATSYLLIRINGKQVSVIFDFTREADFSNKPTSWTAEDKRWFGNALAEGMLASTFGHIVLRQQNLISSDIPFCIGIPSRKMNALAGAAEHGRESAERYLINNIGAEDWVGVCGVWRSSVHWSEMHHIFDEAIEAYKLGLYTAVVNLIMPLIEGILIRYLIANDLGLRNDGQAKKWDSVVDDFRKVLQDRKFGAIRSALANTLLDFISSSSLYKGFSWKDGGEPMGRHSVFHGYELNHGNKVNADRLFMVIDSLYWLTARS